MTYTRLLRPFSFAGLMFGAACGSGDNVAGQRAAQSGRQSASPSEPTSQPPPSTSRRTNCTFTQGFWKNHPDAWPVSSMQLGSRSYDKAQLLAILKKEVEGNGLLALSHQLIAARLNIASGASSANIAITLAEADALIGGRLVPPIGDGRLPSSQTSS